MRRFYVPPDRFDQGRVTLDSDESRHLRDVLRLRIGDEASVFNGIGGEFMCSVVSISRKDAVLTVHRQTEPASPESPLDITVAAAILPGEKFEITVQKAVELGVYRLQPLFTMRCEVKPGGSTSRLERWRKIAVESAKQSGRATLMGIKEPLDFREFLSSAADTDCAKVLFSEREGSGFSSIIPGPRIISVLGPKGGWDDSELAAARDAGFTIVTFGGRILRAETAAIALTAILQHRFGDLS